MQLMTEVSPAVLSDHCIRSYVFAREIAASQDQRSGVDYDDETLYLACLLHDLGLTDLSLAGISFDIDGVGMEWFSPNTATTPFKAPPFTLPGHFNEAINDAPHSFIQRSHRQRGLG